MASSCCTQCTEQYTVASISTILKRMAVINKGDEMSESLLPQMSLSTPNPIHDDSRRERLLNRSNARTEVKFSNLPPSGYYGFVKDGFTTVLNARWYTIIFVFCASYVVSWLVFGLMWWATDEFYQSLYNYTCIDNVDSFSSAFLFSVETQVTIGYGYRFISQNCQLGVVLLLLQSLVGLLVDSFMLGLVFTKLTRPRNRRKTILFSELAVIRSVNGEKQLEFRIADVRRSQLVEAHIRATLYWYREDEQSGELLLEQHDIDLGYDTGRDRLMLLVPVIVKHHITPSSPLYFVADDISKIQQQDFEIVVALEGIVESTGLTVQALWSFTEREILPGYKFKPMVRRKGRAKKIWEVNFGLLSEVQPDT